MSQTEELIEKIKEYVLDEDKIVTTTWLAANLKVKVQEATNLLNTFLNNHRQKKENELLATYILSGVHSNGNLTVALTPENELEVKRNGFERLQNETLFSVQKSRCLDLGLLCLVDRFDSSIEGSIRSKNCFKKTSETATSVSLSDGKKELANKEIIPELVRKDEGVPQNKSGQKTVVAKKNNAGISRFFTKQENVTESQKSKDLTTIMESLTTNEKTTEQNQLESKENALNKTVIEGTKQTPENLETTKSEKTSAENNEKLNKRRKRIICCDSDSDDLFGSEPEMDQELKTVKSRNESNEEMILIEENVVPPKNKKPKLANTDEDCNMFTATEREYETVSSSEVGEEKEQKQKSIEGVNNCIKIETNITVVNKTVAKEKQTKANGKKKKKMNVSTNQPTLMNFFKKC